MVHFCLVFITLFWPLPRLAKAPSTLNLYQRVHSYHGCHAGQQAATLKSLAETFRIPVVVVNQVTAQVHAPATHAFQGSAGLSTREQGFHLTAALGTVWAHAINTRLVLESVADVRYIKVCSLLAM